MKITPRTELVLTLFLFSLMGMFFGAVLIGWLTGCGEHYVDANGVTHNYECFK
jgi:uncharacterized ion transporter superfamily protein YfcC